MLSFARRVGSDTHKDAILRATPPLSQPLRRSSDPTISTSDSTVFEELLTATTAELPMTFTEQRSASRASSVALGFKSRTVDTICKSY